MKSLLKHRLAWPVIALAALLLLNQIFRPDFLGLRMQDGHLYGSLIDIMRNGAPTILIALGMTLVIATRGIDIGAKTQIQKLVNKLAADGMSILFISSELEEVLRVSDRVAVIKDRAMVAEINNDGVSVEDVMTVIAGGAQ